MLGVEYQWRCLLNSCVESSPDDEHTVSPPPPHFFKPLLMFYE